MKLSSFVDRWRSVKTGSERANCAPFFIELCEALELERPGASTGDPDRDRFVFERPVPILHEGSPVTTGFIDLYRKDAFVLEAKMGSEESGKANAPRRGTPSWNTLMDSARGQAVGYARCIDSPPPFVIACDIGYCFDLYAAFRREDHYRDFPHPVGKRIYLVDLLDTGKADLIVTVFEKPWTLDPSKLSAQVTREVAADLADLSRLLEARGHSPETASRFLMRCVFTMFAEDAGLLPEGIFTKALETTYTEDPSRFRPEVEELWRKMRDGGTLWGVGKILRFNGGLFEDAAALDLDRASVIKLHEAAKRQWKEVEPSIFGTLLERALDPKERHRLGAHYTPRAYVERLVRPTIEEPVREEWLAVRVETAQLVAQGKEKAAIEKLKEFHHRLSHIRVLDPACGTANFLYVTLDLFKRIEGEVLAALHGLGYQDQFLPGLSTVTVTPAQFHGIEVNPRAAEIANLVLWIGYLQWHLRNTGSASIPEPVLQNYGNIECRDAVLAWDTKEPLLDEAGNPVTRWDGETMKKSLVTGEPIPDETARVKVERYVNPRKAEWPEADFVVGNPPYIGNWRMRQALGDGYAEALRKTHSDVPESADLVMYWWNHAAELAREKKILRAGLITTNSISQAFQRRVVQRNLEGPDPASLVFAVPDHPWVDSSDGAAVRVAMTVVEGGEKDGTLATVVNETPSGDGASDLVLGLRHGPIHPDLRIGADVASARPLRANWLLACPGVKLHGSGFIVSPEEAARLGLGTEAEIGRVIRPYRNGKDLNGSPRGVYVVDLFGMGREEVQNRFPAIYQWVAERVKPERDQNNRATYRDNWWTFGEPRANFRPALSGLRRFISTVETAKHRVFQFLDCSILPDNKLINIALEDPFYLGVLSSRTHLAWGLAAGGLLEDRPVYIKTCCFDPFPFPVCSDDLKVRIRQLGEDLDAHRRRQQALHPDLTITGMYNVLEKLRSGEALTDKERVIHEKGLVSILKQIHDDLDAAVFEAYGWPQTLTDEEILERLVALNAARAEEEKRGLIRWLRPEFQNPGGQTATQGQLSGATGEDEPEADGTKEAKPWPKDLPAQVAALREFFRGQTGLRSAAEIAAAFKGAKAKDVEPFLRLLTDLGQLLEAEVDRKKMWKGM